MEAILIFRQPDPAEAIGIEEKLKSGAHIVVAAPGIKVNGLAEVVSPLPAALVQKSNKELLNAILAFGDRIAGDKAVSELLNPGSLPIWHYQRFRIFFRLKPLYLQLSAIEHYLSEGHTVVVYCDAGSKRLLRAADDRIHYAEGQASPKQPIHAASVAGYLVYFIVKVFLNFIFPPVLKGKKHVIIDRSVRQRCRHYQTLEHRIDNYTLSNLLDQSGNDFLIINETETPKLRGKGLFRLHAGLFSGLGRRSRTVSGELILIRGLLSPELYRERKRMVAAIDEAISGIGNSGLDQTGRMILDAFTNLAPTNAFFITRFLAFQRFFRRYRFSTVSAIDENSPATRCILDAARSAGAKSIGIQHGNIGDAQPAYLYTEKDRSNHVMADLTLVWGEYWRDFLVRKGNFPENSVIVTGQVRTDIIPVLKSNPVLLKEEFSVKKPVAVFASQPIPDPVMRRKAAADVFTAFSGLPGYELIVKLHPAEKEATGYYRDIARASGCEEYRLLYDVDLYSLLAAAELVITCYSTVGTEAIYFGKPLIILDPLKEDLLGYHKAGIAWQALNADDLRQLAEAVRRNDLKPDPEAMEKFIETYAYRIDGEVCARTLAVIRGAGSGVYH